MAEARDDFNNNNNEKSKTQDTDYWRSFKDLFKEKSLIEASHHEFGDGVKEDFEPSKLSGISRRKFLALVGASAALAGVGCSDYRNKGDIIPYNKMPEDVIVGKANYYASTSTACSNSCGILIKTREGRPIKVDGNPDHPVSKGKTCAKCQANILSLYDPERLQTPKKKASSGNFLKSTWQKADQDIISALKNAGNKKVAIVSHKIVSPTAKNVLDNFTEAYPTTKVYSYELFNEEVRNAAWKKSYGSDTFPLIKWNEAKVIVGLESDFLGTESDKVETARLFSEGRNVNDTEKFNRLYVIEGNLSVTGMNSDYRFRLRPDAQYDFVMSVLSELKNKGVSGIPVPSETLNNFSLEAFAKKHSLSHKNLKLLVEDLIANKGKSILFAGRTLPEQVHIAVNLINDVLGNTALYRTDSAHEVTLPLSSKDEIKSLVDDMNSGNVAVLIHLDSNPAFHFAPDLNYSKAAAKIPMVVSLIGSENESSVLGSYALPIHHDFESWGDFKPRKGFYSFQQPVIDPIFNTRQKEAALLVWASGKSDSYVATIYHKYLMNNWQKNLYSKFSTKLSFEQFWLGCLHDGSISLNEAIPSLGSFNNSVLSDLPQNANDTSGYLVVLRDSYQAGDGRFLNNGWMVELPHPVSKITWDNYAAVSHSTAKELGVDSSDTIEIKVGKKSLKIPVFIQPGAADKTITIELGFGRTVIGVVGQEVGFDAIKLTSNNGDISPWIYKSTSVSKTGGSYKLVSSVEHHMFDSELTRDQGKKRGIIREGSLKEYLKESEVY